MAKYICDFSQLNDISVKLKEISENIRLDEWKNSIDSMANSWKGKASTKFLTRIDEKAYPNLKAIKDSLVEVANYMSKCSKKVNDLEQTLSKMDI